MHKPSLAARHIGVAAAFLLGCVTPLPRADACADPLSAQVVNSCVVGKDVLWRGAKPDVAAATELVNRGVRTVVNLELAHDDRDAFRDARPSMSRPLEIEYFRIRDWEPNVALASGLLDRHVAEFIAITRSQPKPIYVHCRSGQNRTGVMVAAYRVLEENQPIDSAVAEMAGYQGIWFKEDADYIRQLVGERAARLRAMAAERVANLRAEAHLLCGSAGCRPR
ncbi:MAG TPA: dual specificity protein phosphatase family protein [Burkholderiales bacterium]|nr:dual specificity protein phosphatase family protein [Burkholderiales bacterium]